MKRDEMNIGEIVKLYLPRASQEDIDAGSETVVKRIREMRFQVAPAAAGKAKRKPDFDWLNDYHVSVLMAVEELQGYGRPVTITLKAEEIQDVPMVWGTAVFLLLLLMERMGLV